MAVIKQKRSLFLLLFVGCDGVLPYLLALFYPEYHTFRQVISDLGEVGSPVEVAFKYGSIMTGLFLLLSLPGVYDEYIDSPARLRVGLVASLSCFALGQCILSGLFSISPGSGGALSVVMHQLGSALGTIGMLLVPVVLAALYRQLNHLKTARLYLSLSAISIVFSAINGLAQLGYLNLVGLWQRLSMIAMYVPIVFLAVSNYQRKSDK